MPRNAGIPRRASVVLSKRQLIATLSEIDADPAARDRVLRMETDFRQKVEAYLASLASAYRTFGSLKTSPFVLLVLARQARATALSEIEATVIPAKSFSSIETSAGRMIEEVVLPIYGWASVPSTMASSNSSLDGLAVDAACLKVATLKSGPQCLNDTMAERLADDVIAYGDSWAASHGRPVVEYSFGALYGTPARSNKKDWHILRHIAAKAAALGAAVHTSPTGRWDCDVSLPGGTRLRAAVRIGVDWWAYLGGPTAPVEVWIALIRACVDPGAMDHPEAAYTLPGLRDLASIRNVADDFNVALLQRSQLPWLFLVAAHYCDELTD